MEDNKGLSYFFLGLGVGVAVGMIFAPQTGTETRTLIRHRAQEGGDYLRRRSGQLREGATGLVDKGKQLVNRQKEQLAAAVETGRQAYRETVTGEQAADADAPATPAQGI